jgi:hypothetical protein
MDTQEVYGGYDSDGSNGIPHRQDEQDERQQRVPYFNERIIIFLLIFVKRALMRRSFFDLYDFSIFNRDFSIEAFFLINRCFPSIKRDDLYDYHDAYGLLKFLGLTQKSQ